MKKYSAIIDEVKNHEVTAQVELNNKRKTDKENEINEREIKSDKKYTHDDKKMDKDKEKPHLYEEKKFLNRLIQTFDLINFYNLLWTGD